jgi:hypothetical protein
VGSSVGPSVTAANGRLYAAWKGFIGDEQLWWSWFDTQSNAWAAQQKVPNAFSSEGPALGTYRGSPYAMWKAPGKQQNLAFSANESLRNIWTKARPGPGSSGQDAPVNIGVRLQYQEDSFWCWLACAASVAHFYDPNSTVTQPEMMTRIGRALNPDQFGNTTDCVPTQKMLKDDPVLAANLADPFSRAAEFCLEDGPIPRVCHHSGGVGDALKANHNFAGYQQNVTLAEIAKEVDAGRPVCVDFRWTAGPQKGFSHVVIVAGVLNDQILVLDPGFGEIPIAYEDFPSRYFDGGSLLGAAFTKSK